MFVLGTGSFGRVLLCRNKSTEEYGALKVLALADVIRLKQVEHVKNEKNILQEIRHPFIVNLWVFRNCAVSLGPERFPLVGDALLASQIAKIDHIFAEKVADATYQQTIARSLLGNVYIVFDYLKREINTQHLLCLQR